MKRSTCSFFILSFILISLASAGCQKAAPVSDTEKTLDNVQSQIEQNQVAPALMKLKEVITNEPKNSRAYSLLGQALMTQGNIEQAQNAYERAIQLNPDDSENYIGMGLIHVKQGDAKGALANFTMAAQKNPNSPGPFYNLGNLAFAAGQPQAAMNFYQKALQIDPNHAPTKAILAQVAKNLSQASAK